MSWGAQSRSKDAKTPSVGLAMSRKPKPALCGIQPYAYGEIAPPATLLWERDQSAFRLRSVLVLASQIRWCWGSMNTEEGRFTFQSTWV